jgi:hypothetical protein
MVFVLSRATHNIRISAQHQRRRASPYRLRLARAAHPSVQRRGDCRTKHCPVQRCAHPVGRCTGQDRHVVQVCRTVGALRRDVPVWMRATSRAAPAVVLVTLSCTRAVHALCTRGPPASVVRYISEMRTQVAVTEGAAPLERTAALLSSSVAKPLAPPRSTPTTPEHGRATLTDSPSVAAGRVSKESKGLKWRVFLAPLRLISAVRQRSFASND